MYFESFLLKAKKGLLLFSGISVLTFYNVQIVEATLAPVNSNHSAVVLGVVRLVFNIAGCYLITFCNRRTLTIFSGVASGLAMIALATHMYITSLGADGAVEHWLWHYVPIGL